jgi:hypothetical protein
MKYFLNGKNIFAMEKTTGRGTWVKHPRYGNGVISNDKITAWEIYFEKGGKLEISKRNEELEIVEPSDTPARTGLSLDEIEKVLTHVLEKYNGLQSNIELGERWKGGTLIIKPQNPGLQSREIPVESFFHKIVMVRDRLRVLEQNINSNTVLTDSEKVDLQQYITRIYGSLTTFNFLFADNRNYFVGQKS